MDHTFKLHPNSFLKADGTYHHLYLAVKTSVSFLCCSKLFQSSTVVGVGSIDFVCLYQGTS
jgi:hypothetical protein